MVSHKESLAVMVGDTVSMSSRLQVLKGASVTGIRTQAKKDSKMDLRLLPLVDILARLRALTLVGVSVSQLQVYSHVFAAN